MGSACEKSHRFNERQSSSKDSSSNHKIIFGNETPSNSSRAFHPLNHVKETCSDDSSSSSNEKNNNIDSDPPPDISFQIITSNVIASSLLESCFLFDSENSSELSLPKIETSSYPQPSSSFDPKVLVTPTPHPKKRTSSEKSSGSSESSFYSLANSSTNA